MSNRFICRGKRKDNDEWVEGYYVCLNENCHRIYIGYAEKDCGDYYPEYCEVIPETVGKCTGLKDKNGKLIFEGDVVKDKDSGLFGKVVFATSADGFDGMTGFMVDDVDDGLQNYNGFWHLVEVIGNIHDNPELLEVER